MTRVLTDLVLSALRELIDVQYQYRVWTGRDPGREMSSFEESVERLFTDSALTLELDAGREVFGSSIDGDLRAISQLVGRIDAMRPAEEIIDDPLMEQVRHRAEAILHALDEDGHVSSN